MKKYAASSVFLVLMLALPTGLLAKKTTGLPAGVTLNSPEGKSKSTLKVDWCRYYLIEEETKEEIKKLARLADDAKDGEVDAARDTLADDKCGKQTESDGNAVRFGKAVFLELTHFNFLRFASEVSIQTTECEACAELTRLWQGIFDLTSLSVLSMLDEEISSLDDAIAANEDATKGIVDEITRLEERTADGSATEADKKRITTLKIQKAALAKDLVALEAQNRFWKNFKSWRETVQTHAGKLKKIRDNYKSEYLTKKEITDLEAKITSVGKLVTELKKDRDETFALVFGRDALEVFDKLDTGSHSQFISAAGSFIKLAKKSKNGQKTDIRKLSEDPIKANSFVTVTVASETADSEATGHSLDASYFLHPKIPLRAHFGIVHSELSDFTFEQVRTAQGFDVFSQVKEESGTEDLVAFMSYEFGGERKRAEGVRVQLTLGTGFSDPGETIYVGAGVRFMKRIVFTAGLAFGSVVEGDQPAEVGLGEELEDVDNLFLTIKERSEEKVFFALSVMVR